MYTPTMMRVFTEKLILSIGDLHTSPKRYVPLDFFSRVARLRVVPGGIFVHFPTHDNIVTRTGPKT